MFYAALVLLYLAVFAFLIWRIITRAKPNVPPTERFVCPHCNETHCDCYKGNHSP
jgi:hypothetical protein